MITIEPTKTIQLTEDTLVEVANCSDAVKQLVVYLDDWRQKEVDLTSDLLRTRAALNDLRNSLIQQFQAELQEAEQEVIDNAPPAELVVHPEDAAIAEVAKSKKPKKKDKTL